MRQTLIQLICRLDELMLEQVQCVMRHSRFQSLEASWRGIALLVNARSKRHNTAIKLLNVSLKTLEKDICHAVEFDQSHLFKLVHDEEYGQAGGEPYGLLIGDYYFSHKPNSAKIDTMAVLEQLANIAAASFCPFVSSVSANLFGLESFNDLPEHFQLSRLFEQTEYLRWNQARQNDNMRYIGLLTPRILIEPKNNLFGNAVYPYAITILKSFEENGWFANIHASSLEDLPHAHHEATLSNILAKPLLETRLTNTQEKALNENGIMAASDNSVTESLHFYSCHSFQKPQQYNKAIAEENAYLSSLLNYLLCCTRFAHYIKVLMRDKLGSLNTSQECERYIHNWINQYCAASNDQASHHYPLHQARVEITESLNKPGQYQCLIYLKPHYQIDSLQPILKLKTHISP